MDRAEPSPTASPGVTSAGETRDAEKQQCIAPDEGSRSLDEGASEQYMPDRSSIIAKVEAIFESIADALLGKTDRLTIILASRPLPGCSTITRPDEGYFAPGVQDRIISFPGNNPEEAWRFTVLVRILELIHDALTADVLITKRDIYYRDPALFVRQSVVDRYVDDLARTFQVPRSFLRVVAAAKGLVAGNFSLKRSDNTVISGLADREGVLVPTVSDVDIFSLSAIQRIIVIEKEATFRHILLSPSWSLSPLSSTTVLLTGKGYPDISSRRFLHALSTPSTQNFHAALPIYALVDYDPDGIDILSTYKYGSALLAHERHCQSQTIKWLGLKSDHFTQNNAVTCTGTNEHDLHSSQGLLGLSSRDRRRATRMLARESLKEDGREPAWRRELQVMLILNRKAEIQLLESRKKGLVGWLEEQLSGET